MLDQPYFRNLAPASPSSWLPCRGDREACNLLSRAGYYGVFVTTETVMAGTAHRSRDGEGKCMKLLGLYDDLDGEYDCL